MINFVILGLITKLENQGRLKIWVENVFAESPMVLKHGNIGFSISMVIMIFRRINFVIEESTMTANS